MSLVGVILFFMASLTDLDVRLLEFAQKREQNPHLPIGQVIAEFEISPTRYTQMLMHLVQQPEVVSDPRWTQLAYRIQRVMAARALMRAARKFPARSA